MARSPTRADVNVNVNVNANVVVSAGVWTGEASVSQSARVVKKKKLSKPPYSK